MKKGFDNRITDARLGNDESNIENYDFGKGSLLRIPAFFAHT